MSSTLTTKLVRSRRISRNKNTENKPVQITSTDINLALVEIHHIITSSGISTKFIYTAPPFLGGRSTKFDLIFDMFNLYEFGIPPQKVVDIIEISIGVYESNRTKSISRMFNPFFWLGWVADAISEVLFDVMENSVLAARMLKNQQ